MLTKLEQNFWHFAGDWVISGGFSEPPSNTQQVTIKSVEVINPNIQKAESDMPISLSQHCIVHVYCYYTFLAGGTGNTGNKTKNNYFDIIRH